MKRMQRKLKIIFLVLFSLFLITILPVLRFHSEPNLNALPSRFVKGVYHIHSTLSDGSGEVSEIMKTAEDLKLDFVILTDHGEPNRASLGATAWWGRTLLIGGTELSLNSGHLAAFGFPVPIHPLPPEPGEAMAEVSHSGGLTFISHPFDKAIPWTDWRPDGFSGLEVLSAYSSARRASLLNLITFPARYMFNQKYALLQTLKYPAVNMEKWDELNMHGRYSGIFALDAHGLLPLSSGMRLPFPSYRSMFSILNIYVCIDRELVKDAAQSVDILVDAMRKRHFFNVVEAIAPANGFDTRFIPAAAPDRRVRMGDESPWSSGQLEVDLPFGFETRIRLIHNGKVEKEITSGLKHRVTFQINAPGTYRLEIFIPANHFSGIPWIVTNPFFLGVPESTNADLVLLPQRQFFPISSAGNFQFVPEKNEASECRVERLDEDGDGLAMTFHLVTPDEAKDGWCAAALREELNFSNFAGISFDARSSPPARYWVELRSGINTSESWFHHSFSTQAQWNSVDIPFNRLFRYSGDQAISLSAIQSMFISISNRLAASGMKGRLEVKNIRLFTPAGNPSQSD